MGENGKTLEEVSREPIEGARKAEGTPKLAGATKPGSARARAGASGRGGRKPVVQTITKKELVDRIAERTGQRRSAVKDVVQDFLELVSDELALGRRLEFRDFGVFEVKSRAERTAQNPKTMQRVTVPAKRTVKFKVGRKMKELLEADAEALAEVAQRVEVKLPRTAGDDDGEA